MIASLSGHSNPCWTVSLTSLLNYCKVVEHDSDKIRMDKSVGKDVFYINIALYIGRSNMYIVCRKMHLLHKRTALCHSECNAKMHDLVNKVQTRCCFICCVCQMFTYLTVWLPTAAPCALCITTSVTWYVSFVIQQRILYLTWGEYTSGGKKVFPTSLLIFAYLM